MNTQATEKKKALVELHYPMTKDVITGLIAALVSVILLLVQFLAPLKGFRDIENPLLWIVHLITAFWLLFLLARSGFRFRRLDPRLYISLAIMMFSGAFILNDTVDVISKPAGWLWVYLSVSCLSLFLFCFLDRLPSFFLKITAFTSGSSLFLYLYFSLLTLPVLPFSVVGLVILGISAYAFAPLGGLYAFFLIRKHINRQISSKWFNAGLLLPLLLLSGHLALTGYYHLKLKGLTESRSGLSQTERALVITQSFPDNFIANHYLLNAGNADDFNQIDRLLFNGNRSTVHDPLYLFTSLCFPNPLNSYEKEQVIRLRSDLLHAQQRRLWSADDLSIQTVNEHIKVWPEYRMAYTEMTLTVRNNNTRLSNQQEAVFTFQLPEGAVCSSLSLWINDKECKARFAGKNQANLAYETIVGVESRDPVQVEWQEGNRLRVTLFPCTPAVDRQMKIGITSPLRLHDGSLRYEHITFQGPPALTADADYKIEVSGGIEPQSAPFALILHEKSRHHTHHGPFIQHWSMDFPILPLSKNTFAFNHHQYSLSPATPSGSGSEMDAVYLDLNMEWSESEVLDFIHSTDLPVYAFNSEGQILLTAENYTDVFQLHDENRFSLFPFHLMNGHQHPLIITRTNPMTPGIASLHELNYYGAIKAYFSGSHSKPAVADLGHSASAYLHALSEMRHIQYGHFKQVEIEALLKEKQLPDYQEDDNNILVSPAGMYVKRAPASGKFNSSAPDHLMRLFIYGKILGKSGFEVINSGEDHEELVKMAAEGNVVTPVSSLIVLETEADYDRFGIEEQGEGQLKNADEGWKPQDAPEQHKTWKDDGGVPEPHEWMLIIMTAVVLGWMGWKKYGGRRWFAA